MSNSILSLRAFAALTAIGLAMWTGSARAEEAAASGTDTVTQQVVEAPAPQKTATESTKTAATSTPKKTLVAAATKKPAAPSRTGLRVGRRRVLTGTASFYSKRLHGRRTFSGERYNMNAMTLASRSLPMGTRVRVTNLRNGKSVVGRVNDFGPSRRHRSRVVDLSTGMARKLGQGSGTGLIPVRVEVESGPVRKK